MMPVHSSLPEQGQKLGFLLRNCLPSLVGRLGSYMSVRTFEGLFQITPCAIRIVLSSSFVQEDHGIL